MNSASLLFKASISATCMVAGFCLGNGFRGDRVYDSLSASQFLLCDASGRTCARLSLHHESPSLEYLDARGNCMMRLFLNGDAGALMVSGPAGGVSITTSPGPVLTLCQRDGVGRIQMQLSGAAETPNIEVLDEHGRPRGSLSLDSEGKASLCLAMDKELMPPSGIMHKVIALEVRPNGEASLDMTSASGLEEHQSDLHLTLEGNGHCAVGGSEEVIDAITRGLRAR